MFLKRKFEYRTRKAIIFISNASDTSSLQVIEEVDEPVCLLPCCMPSDTNPRVLEPWEVRERERAALRALGGSSTGDRFVFFVLDFAILQF
jgi:hypothetical protein